MLVPLKSPVCTDENVSLETCLSLGWDLKNTGSS